MEYRTNVGGKAYNLAILKSQQLNVPNTLVLSSEVYDSYISSTGLDYKLPLLINKKDFKDMRWEEIWDLSIAIENLFIKTDIPLAIKNQILEKIEFELGLNNLAIRSSSIFEDSPDHSFAGLHESYMNISGKNSIIKHIKLVWASLWSNRALMYRNELNLDINTASMGVVIQNIIEGDVSGIAFGKDPMDKNEIIIEAVYGLNQALVDGIIEPDRWTFNKETLELRNHVLPLRKKYMVLSPRGVALKIIPPELSQKTPLSDVQLKNMIRILIKLEKFYKRPQEIEWTIRDSKLFILQCRPITTIIQDSKGYDSEDQRPWYLSLVRSFEDLKEIRDKVEKEYFPQMNLIASELLNIDLARMNDEDLSEEIEKRWDIFNQWKDVYWQEFIPLAHGIRLFGKIYNTVVEPDDPSEFTILLSGTNMISTQRNSTMRILAAMIRNNNELQKKIEQKDWEDSRVEKLLNHLKEDVIDNTAMLFFEQDFEKLVNILLQMANSNDLNTIKKKKDIDEIKQKYLSHFPEEKKEYAKSLLTLGKDCYRLRDDDNIMLGKIEKRYIEAVNEGIIRLKTREIKDAEFLNRAEILKALRDKNYEPEVVSSAESKSKVFEIKARQIVGQAASSGIARGKARVVVTKEDIFNFKQGEILVVDSIEPNMTFIVPLASGIVERRGGILVHGAIIAREYEIPCVTGIPNATKSIKTGDFITVDGHLGLIIIKETTEI